MASREDTRALAGELAGILEAARPMALMPRNVCVDAVVVRRIVERMRAASAGPAPGFGDLESERDASLVRAAQAVERAVRRGYAVPFTDQVRLSRRRAAELAAALRDAAA